MLTDRNYFLLAVLLYAFSTLYSVFLWRKGFRRDDIANYLLLVAAFILHSTALFKRGIDLKHCPVYNLYEATTFFTWFTALTFLVIGAWHRFRFLGAFIAPVLLGAGVFALMPQLDPPRGDAPQFTGALQSIHAAMSLLSYAAFGLSCAAAGMFWTQENNLKQHRPGALLSLLPPMQRLESAVRGLMLAGWLLLTIGLVTGAIYLQQYREQFKPDAGADLKIIWAAVVWTAYLVLLVAQWRGRLTGRRFALAAIGGFIFVALTFWGTNLLSPIHQQ